MAERECGNCGEIVGSSMIGKCKACGEDVCPNCQATFNQFTQIDYDLHQTCADEDREDY